MCYKTFEQKTEVSEFKDIA